MIDYLRSDVVTLVNVKHTPNVRGGEPLGVRGSRGSGIHFFCLRKQNDLLLSLKLRKEKVIFAPGESWVQTERPEGTEARQPPKSCPLRPNSP